MSGVRPSVTWVSDDERVYLGKVVPSSYKGVGPELSSGRQADAAGLGRFRRTDQDQNLVDQLLFVLVRLHTKDARRRGETPERLAVLSAWRATGLFFA
jgi:hypothetical protein